ncbi:MAG TPA: bifunctional nuclease family protein [Acidimicrobiales bacterium]|nr:bifunctional nuclease family protein [Acidimicrobiales bacterium]
MASEGPASATTGTGPGPEGQPADADAVSTDAESGPPIPNGTNGIAVPAEAAPVDEAVTDDAVTDDAATDPGTPEEPARPEEAGHPAHLWAVVMVFDIAVDLPTPHARLTLREVAEPHRMLEIPIGLPEGTALAHAWRGVPTPRPLTHELFSEVLTRLGATIEVVRLTGRRAGIVLAEMELSSPKGREVVPCRPTDGVTLSVRQGVPAPILVDLRLFESEGDVDPEG